MQFLFVPTQDNASSNSASSCGGLPRAACSSMSTSPSPETSCSGMPARWGWERIVSKRLGRAIDLGVLRTGSSLRIRRLRRVMRERKRIGGNNPRAVLGRVLLCQSAFRGAIASPLLRLQSQPRPCARHVKQDVSHSRVGGALGQPLTIVRTISAHRGGKHGSITVGRLSDAEWGAGVGGAFPSETELATPK
jgi:hypothetical protein